jgi:cyclophilin family peptidyl-prolyl cis-trans isomerase
VEPAATFGARLVRLVGGDQKRRPPRNSRPTMALSVGLVAALVLAGCSSPAPGGNTTGSNTTGGNGTSGQGADGGTGAKPDCNVLIRDANGSNAKHTKLQVDTNQGMFKVELFDDASPKTAANFKGYAQAGFFDHVVYHRILSDFMMQGGKFDNTTKTAKQPTQGTVVNEATSSGCKNKAYTLSMARTNDPDSAQSEFFVNFQDNSFLDPGPTGAGYTVFGIVYEGRDVVDRIEKVPVHVYNPSRDPMCQPEQGNRPNCPDQPVEMVRVQVM